MFDNPMCSVCRVSGLLSTIRVHSKQKTPLNFACPPRSSERNLTPMSTMPEIDDTTTPVITVLAKFAHELAREILDFAPVDPDRMSPFVVAQWGHSGKVRN